MRTLRVVLAGPLMLILLGAWGTAAAAQVDPLAVPVSGLVVDSGWHPEVDWHREQIGRVEEFRLMEYDLTIDWSDARLPTHVRVRGNWDDYPSADANSKTRPRVHVGTVADDHGSWLGTLVSTRDEQGVWRGQMVLEGAGVNDGLVAVLGLSAAGDSIIGMRDRLGDVLAGVGEGEFDGLLIQGELPSQPDLPLAEPPAE